MMFRSAFVDRDLEKEQKEKAKIAARQQNRAEILERLLNGSSRGGVDLEAVSKQIEEKRSRELSQAERDATEVAENARIVAAVDALRRAEEQQRRQIKAAALQDLSHQIEHPEQRDSYALNNKAALRHSTPVRQGDDDPRLGPCSAQVFGGEDLLAPERKKLLAVQQETWLTQQMEERRERERREREEELAYAAHVASAVAAVEGIGGALQAQVADRAKEAARVNARLAEEARRRRAAEKEEDKMASQISMETLTMRGAGMGLLAEDPADGLSAADPRRFRPDHYRGLPSSATADMRRQHEEQAAEKEAQRQAEARAEAERLRLQQMQLRQAMAAERSQAAAASQGKAAHLAALQAQIEEKEAARRAAREADRSTPAFGNAFFDAFGRSLK